MDAMWVGWIEFDVLLGDVHSLKSKRSVVRPLVADLRRKFDVAAAEVDHLDLHRRAMIGISFVSADRDHLERVLDAADRFVAVRPEVDLLSSRQRLVRSDDE